MKIAQRIHLFQLLKDEDYARLVAFLDKHRSCMDELTLFTGFCHHGAIPLSELQPQADILALRVADLKKRGYKSVGLNVHTTFGHIDEGYDYYGQPFHPMVGCKGDLAKSCFCPQHADMRKFILDKYTMYAKCGPDFMYVDDDVKYFWNGVKFACFCPECIARFNRKIGADYTRETLVAAMEEPDSVQLRAAWVQEISDKITELFADIKNAVRAVDPNIRLGFATQHQGWSTYNGMDFAAWLPALDADFARPGEGTYDDKTPVNLITKAISCARQAAEYPASVTDVQYEVEDFPNYSLLQKSTRFNLGECTLAIAQGMNAVLLNTLSPDPVMTGLDLDPMYAAMAAARIEWDKMEAFAKGMHGIGFYPAISTKYDQRRPLHNGESFFVTYDEAPKHNVLQTYSLSHIGIPLTVEPQNSYGAVFTGNLADGFTDEELLGFLKTSVILDSDSVRAFQRQGLAKYIGVTCDDREYTDSITEVFTDHPVNEGLVGFSRDVHPAFFGSGAAILNPIDENVQVIGNLCGLHGENLGITAALFENELGGRVCILGYAAYHKVDSYAKLLQMQRVCAWLAKGESLTKFYAPWLAAQFVRTDGKRTMATLVNLSLDPAESTEFGIKGAKTATLLYRGEEMVLTAKERNGYGVFSVPQLLSLETAVLMAE